MQNTPDPSSSTPTPNNIPAQQVGSNVTQSSSEQPSTPQNQSLVDGKNSSTNNNQAIPKIPATPLNNDPSERLWGAISYIPMLALLALIVKPKSDYIKLHGKQGLLIFLIFFCTLFLYLMIEPLGPLLAGLIQLGLFVVGIYSAFMAFMGNWWKIPVLGDVAESIPVDFLTKVTTQAITGEISSTQNNPEETKPPSNNSTSA